MKYVLVVRVGEDADPTPEEADPTDWIDHAERGGVLLLAQRLAEPSDATTVRVREGRTLVADGPFAEYKEHVAGLALIEVPDLDAALAQAQTNPVATFGCLEVRAVWPF